MKNLIMKPKKLAEVNNKLEEVLKFLPYAEFSETSQQLLVFEQESEYRTLN